MAAGAEQLGDCIDCMACVNVCPVGIDIRNGQQLECITCALCIDACDDVMEKIGKPRGLIDYLALSDEGREKAGGDPRPAWQHILRPRTIMYTALWAGVGLALLIALFIRPEIDMTVAPVRNPIYVTLSDGSIRNTYDIRLLNKHGEARQFNMSLSALSDMRISLEGTPYTSVLVPANETLLQRVYVTATRGSEAANGGLLDIRFWVEDLTNGERAFTDSTFNGKGTQ